MIRLPVVVQFCDWSVIPLTVLHPNYVTYAIYSQLPKSISIPPPTSWHELNANLTDKL